jgi:hypothetical protein
MDGPGRFGSFFASAPSMRCSDCQRLWASPASLGSPRTLRDRYTAAKVSLWLDRCSTSAMLDELGERLMSAIIPTDNCTAWRETAVGSVLSTALIAAPSQVIVIGDDPQDETNEVANRPGVQPGRAGFHNPRGPRDAGLKLACTLSDAVLDEGNARMPRNMEAQFAALDAHDQMAFLSGRAQSATDALEPTPCARPQRLSFRCQSRAAIRHLLADRCGTFPARGAVRVGCFDPTIRNVDGHLMLRIAPRHRGLRFRAGANRRDEPIGKSAAVGLTGHLTSIPVHAVEIPELSRECPE